MAPRAVVPPELKRGPFSLAEAQQAGLTRDQLRGTGWRRVARGLYVWGGLGQGPALSLAAVQRRVPVGAAFSGRTAAWLDGLDLPPCDPTEVTIPRLCGVSALEGALVRRAELPPGDVVERKGLPVTSALRTVTDIGRQQPLVEAVVAADMALHARLVDLAKLGVYVAAHPRSRGIAQLRRVLELAEPATESPMETRLRLLLVLAGLPRPHAPIAPHDAGGRFLARPDLYYPARRLGLEYDGGGHRDSLVEDDRRQNRLLGAGYRLLRFTAADLHHTPDRLVTQVRDVLTHQKF
jgi:hypothetical protein